MWSSNLHIFFSTFVHCIFFSSYTHTSTHVLGHINFHLMKRGVPFHTPPRNVCIYNSICQQPRTDKKHEKCIPVSRPHGNVDHLIPLSITDFHAICACILSGHLKIIKHSHTADILPKRTHFLCH